MKTITARPLTLRAANEYIAAFHRHHARVQGHKFSIAAINSKGEIVGVVVVGRPVARLLDDGFQCEVTRLCTDGTPNVCSYLYSRAARCAKEMGYRRIVTYILAHESGNSLKATGWVEVAASSGGSWSRPSRNRTDKHPTAPKKRWEREL